MEILLPQTKLMSDRVIKLKYKISDILTFVELVVSMLVYAN